jgi:cobalt-zinc-cadmium efflux system membrane fusion protein
MKNIFMKSNQLVILLCCVFLFACTATKKDKEITTDNKTSVTENVVADIVVLSPAQLKSANIISGIIEKREMHKIIKVSGVIDVPPSNIVSISIPLGGYLKKTSLIPGTLVKKGAVLATLEDPSYIQLQEDYLTSKSKLTYLEADFNRQKTLSETKATSDKLFQLAKSEYESQKYMVKALSEKLKLIGLNPLSLNENNISRAVDFYAPISGYVTKVNVNIGKYVSPTDVLFEIVDPSDLHLRLTVFENDASNLKIGNKVTYYINNNINEKHKATIIVFTPNINENRSTDVHCHLASAVKNLYPGTFANAEIELNNAKVNAIPEEAIVKWENKPHVFLKVANDSYKLVPVVTGLVTNGFIEIITPLGSQEVVTKNAYTLMMKLKNSAEE